MSGARKLKVLLLGLAVLVAAVVLAACGGGSSSSGSSSVASTGNGKNATSAPEIEDWPLFGRDRDNTRFATQDEVNTENVDDLAKPGTTGSGPHTYLWGAFPLG